MHIATIYDNNHTIIMRTCFNQQATQLIIKLQNLAGVYRICNQIAINKEYKVCLIATCIANIT